MGSISVGSRGPKATFDYQIRKCQLLARPSAMVDSSSCAYPVRRRRAALVASGLCGEQRHEVLAFPGELGERFALFGLGQPLHEALHVVPCDAFVRAVGK
jgi:hypothetical protein